MRKIVLGITAFIIIVCSFAMMKLNRTKSNTNNFVVGIATNYAPFISINERGDYEGFDIDVAKSLAQQLGKTLTFKDLGSMAPLFMSLQQGSVDAIMWGISITQDRLKRVAFVHYQGQTTTTYPLIFWESIPKRITSINDMKGLTVCVEPASSQEPILDKYPLIIKRQTEKVDDALLNIQYGKADAALVEPAIALKFKKRFPEIQILDVPLAQEDQVQGIGIALKKENRALTQELQQAVNKLKSKGIIQSYEKKWNIS